MNPCTLKLLAMIVGVTPLLADAAEKRAGRDPAVWEPAIQRFEADDKAKPPPTGAILLVGGSNARRWTDVGQYFPGEHVINRGFGGAKLADVLHFANRIVLPYAPRVIFLNAGGNDLSSGQSPEAVRDRCRDFVRQVSGALPKTRIYYLSIPPVLRAAQAAGSMAVIRRTNGLIAELARTESALTYVDLFTQFLGADGQPRPELFVEDGTHFSAHGQAIVAALLQEKMTAASPAAPDTPARPSVVLPMGSAPVPLEAGWFPSRLHTFVWRNWTLVPAARMAMVVGATAPDIERVGRSMGLAPPRGLGPEQWKRAHLTIIRRNWHLLPYEQILTLLGWTPERMAYTLREDDFFFHKLGDLKPASAPLRWSEPTAAENARAGEIAALVRSTFPGGKLEGEEPLFSFVGQLQSPPLRGRGRAVTSALRMGYSYFALCGDPLIDPSLDPYPDGLLARLAAAGENAVWLHVELGQLAAVPWMSDGQIHERQAALRRLAARAAEHRMKIFLYLNEPRALPTTSAVFSQHADWRGVEEKGFNALCTSAPEVRAAIRDAVTEICRAVPELGGFFTITASENLTNCWSHQRGNGCPRCRDRSPAEVIAEVCSTIAEGVRRGAGGQRYLCWDWGWRDEWALDVIARLPANAELLSVSEWSLPIERGGVTSTVGEYSISSIGPGPRALRHWAAAQKRGLTVAAKIQCGNTWELSAVPYLPVLENITRHATALRAAGVQDIMLGWTLGGYPSPNIEAVEEIYGGGSLETLAQKRHGEATASAAVAFWRECSAAFREFPYNSGTVYRAPLQMGPANPLWNAPTRYKSCMVGIPYDDLAGWRSIYPAEVFATQLEKVAAGFESALVKLRAQVSPLPALLAEEARFTEAAAIHFASVANQCRAVMARDSGDEAAWREQCGREAALATRLHAIQSLDSRIGFEASNQYYYVPLDLVEKVVNCRWAEERMSQPTIPSAVPGRATPR